ncbi:YggU-like protein [Tothia fuscella]|uniref:YggU-like protein n=1 Tax=Tothia fuscella TaxID=1048955 RepID=A0A9P4P2C0_9PEZI|nr:YggU-like protein [Tothia fuscella]
MAAVRYIASKSRKTIPGFLHLSCHVKPGASSEREGILSVTDSAIVLCVAAPARGGEANKAVRELLANVLQVSKSEVEVIKGLKSKYKILSVQLQANRQTESEIVEKIMSHLREAVEWNAAQ